MPQQESQIYTKTQPQRQPKKVQTHQPNQANPKDPIAQTLLQVRKKHKISSKTIQPSNALPHGEERLSKTQTSTKPNILRPTILTNSTSKKEENFQILKGGKKNREMNNGRRKRKK